jgi:hypothetical protein
VTELHYFYAKYYAHSAVNIEENATCRTTACFVFIIHICHTKLGTTQLIATINWFTIATTQFHAIGRIGLVVTTYIFILGVNLTTTAHLI